MQKSSKRIAVLGGGVAGTAFALFLKEKNPSYEVTIFEAKDKVASRILVSGNGRANFFNTDYLNPSLLKDPIFERARKVVEKDYGKDAFNDLINLTSCPYFTVGNLVYPFANKSQALFDSMMDCLKKEKVIVKEEKLMKILSSSEKEVVFTTIDKEQNKRNYSFPKVVLSLGGSSLAYPPFDWNMLSSLKIEHIPFTPAICPLKVKEQGLKPLDGSRVKCLMTLLKNGKEIYKEEGEVLFKNDGISGICVFNASIRLDPNDIHAYSISLDLCDHSGMNIRIDNRNIDYAFPKNISDYLKKRSKEEGKSLEKEASSLLFHIDALYPFKASQVSKGGISFDEINPANMTLKKHPNIITLGEMVDIPLPCGGYNIGLCIIEAYKSSLKLLEERK